MTKGHKRTFQGDREVSSHACGGGYMTEHICQNSSNYILKIVQFYDLVNYTSISLTKIFNSTGVCCRV